LFYRRSNTGPASGTLQYSIGAGAYSDISTLSFSSSSSSGASITQVSISGISTLQAVAAGNTINFRITLYGNGAANGTFYVFSTGLQIGGAVVAAGNTVTFNNNGGSGSMTNQTASASTALSSNLFTRSGYYFSGWNTASDGSGTTYTDGASYSFTSDVTLYAQWQTPSWNGTTWSNTTGPTSSLNAIIDGNLTTSADLACKDLTINANRTLTIAAGNKLTVSGNLINNGTIVFKSNATSTAMFGVFNGTQSGTGVVTTERYIPAKRAFRFLSPSVTTTTSIKLNWQENAGTTAGLGTHITGVDGATNGFDATATNNPSLYTFDNSTGAWVAVTSTLSNTLTAGTPYRLMVRGDRLVNLSTNTPTATETVLRATGTLKTGSFSPTLNQAVEGFSFVGNPYQAPLDIEAVLNAATNMNTGVAYYWDPTLNARGGYVARNLTTNSNDVTSNFNEFLQPGQAVFVKKANTASAASVTIIESHKSVANGAAGVFRTTTPNDYGLLRVNLQANNNNQWQTIEGTLAIFNSGFNTAVTDEDATKMANLDEEVSFVQNNTSLAIACQPNPTATTELPIRLTNTRYTNYQWQFDLTNYSGPTPFLVDTQNNSITQITNTTVVPFTTDSNANRFKIVFQNALLNTDTFATQVGLYPNPSKGNGFYLQLPATAQATVRLYNTLGQEIAISHNEGHYQAKQSLAAGVYHVMVTQGEKTSKLKWIVE
jgi:uncharacterized repeat protein (TIGR02543 family)